MNLIAETAWHHDGDINFFLKLVETICLKTKCDYIKYHVTLDVDEYMHIDHPGYEWAKERVLTQDEWKDIFDLTEKHGKKLMLLFNDKRSIEFGMQFNPDLVEIHSVCLNDINLLKSLKNTIGNKPTKIVLGVGGTDLYEIEYAINFLENDNIVMMHGFQNYPTEYKDINFSKIKKIMSLYSNLDHGYADHTVWNNENNVFITMMGAALGMDYIEKHVTTDPGEGRTDWQAAITIEDFVEIQEKMKLLSMVKGNGLLKMNKGEEAYSTFGVMKKAAILNKDIPANTPIKLADFTFKRTGQNSDLSQLDVLSRVGQKSSRNLKKGDCLLIENFK